MQLEGALNNFNEVQKIYNRCLHISDSCNALEYKIYATEEIARIYNNNKLEKAYYYNRLLDSIEVAYSKKTNAEILNENERVFIEKKNNHEKNTLLYLLLAIILATGSLSLFLFIKFRQKSKAKKKLRIEFNLMQAEVEKYLSKPAIEFVSQDHITSVKVDQISLPDNLTNRQKEILQCIADGLTNREIAVKLFISENTVKYHTKNLYSILKVNNRSEFFRKYTFNR